MTAETQSPSTPAALDDLRQENELLGVKIEVAQKKAILQQIKPLHEAWGDFVGGPGPGTDYDTGATWGQPWMSASTIGAMLGDRVDGRFRPFWETEQQLAQIRARARFLAQLDCNGVGILEKLTDYVIGTGFKFTASMKKNVPDVPGLSSFVQEVFDEFFEENCFIGDRDREIFGRSHRDGECFIGSYHVGDGHTQLRFAEPEAVVQPADGQRIADHYGLEDEPLDWYFGIATDSSDIETVHGYHVVWQPGNWSDFSFLPPLRRNEYEEGSILHIKQNVDRNIKRGCSDYYPAFTWLENAAKLGRNTAIGAAVQAAIAYIIESVEGTSKASALNFQAGQADGQYPVPQQGGGNRQAIVVKREPGSTVVVPKGQKYIAAPMGDTHSPIYIQVFQQCMRIVGNRWSMPEYMISGDASNANMASTMVAESPWVKSCERRQGTYKPHFLSLTWNALRNAVMAGRFKQFGLEGEKGFYLLRQAIHISAEPPTLVARDPRMETQQREIQKRNGVLSRKTWASMEGNDYDQEVANGAVDEGGGAPSPLKSEQQLGDSIPKPPEPGPGLSESSPAERLAGAASIHWRGYP